MRFLNSVPQTNLTFQHNDLFFLQLKKSNLKSLKFEKTKTFVMPLSIELEKMWLIFCQKIACGAQNYWNRKLLGTWRVRETSDISLVYLKMREKKEKKRRRKKGKGEVYPCSFHGKDGYTASRRARSARVVRAAEKKNSPISSKCRATTLE